MRNETEFLSIFLMQASGCMRAHSHPKPPVCSFCVPEPQSPRYMSYTCLYRGSEIGIDCIECENPSERNYMLAAFLSGVTVKLPAACDLGIALGDDAFVRMTGEGCTYIAMCRKNIVLQLMCNTSDSVDLLPLATELDRQLHDN